MKNVILLLFVATLIIPFQEAVFPQAPEKVYSIVKVQKTFDWYKKQAQLWKKEIDKNKKNADAWMSFYTANRMARLTDRESWNNQKNEYLMDLNEIIKIMEKSIPNTFECYYLQFYNSGDWSEESFKIMFKAHELGPERPELFDELTGYYEVKRDMENRDRICKKWFNSNEIAQGILNFNYNVLASMEDDGIIITNGDNDTYPIWVLQGALGIKKKIIVLNVSMITIDPYREKIFKEIGIPELKLDMQELKKESDIHFAIQYKIIKHLTQYSKRPLYFAMTLLQDYYRDLEKYLYPVGLAFKYSKKDFDNIAILRKNYEKNFLIDYLKMNFYNDISAAVVESTNSCYLAGFLKLFEHYKASGEMEKMKEVKSLIMKIAENTEKDDAIRQWIKSSENQ